MPGEGQEIRRGSHTEARVALVAARVEAGDELTERKQLLNAVLVASWLIAQVRAEHLVQVDLAHAGRGASEALREIALVLGLEAPQVPRCPAARNGAHLPQGLLDPRRELLHGLAAVTEGLERVAQRTHRQRALAVDLQRRLDGGRVGQELLSAGDDAFHAFLQGRT